MKFYIKVLILLFSLSYSVSAMAGEDITGKWQGKLVPAPGNELVIQFIITKADDGSYSVVLNSPDQGAIKDIKASSVSFESGKLTMDVTDLSGSYEGIFKDGKFEGSWKQEGTSIPLNLSPYKKPVLSEEDKKVLLGEWYGPLDIPQVSITAVVRFEIKDNKLAGFWNTPEEGSTQTPITDIELDDGNFGFKLAGALEYKGKLKDNQVVGKLYVRGQAIPITLKKGKFKAPTYALKLSEETRQNLSGEWHGQLKMPKNILHVQFKFETTDKGEFLGFYGLPDNNVNGIPFSEANESDDKIVLKIKVSNAEFKGEIKGDRLIGQWSQAGVNSIPMELKKGEYIPPVYNLKLPAETITLLSGEWHGELLSPPTLAHIVLRFETTDKGEFFGFYHVHRQKDKEVKVFEADQSDGKIMLKIPNTVFRLQPEGDKLKGEVELADGKRASITLNRDKFIPPEYNLDLSDDVKAVLSGEWVGEYKVKDKAYTVLFVFKTTEKGEFTGVEKIPGLALERFPVIGADLSDGMLSIKVPDAEFKGKLTGDKVTGEAITVSGGLKLPFSAKKGKYVPPVYGLKLPEKIMKALSGKWKGKLGNDNMVFRFEKNKNGDFTGFIDNIDNNQIGIPIKEASMSEGSLTLEIQYNTIKGKLSGGTLECEWGQGKTPLTMKKE